MDNKDRYSHVLDNMRASLSFLFNDGMNWLIYFLLINIALIVFPLLHFSDKPLFQIGYTLVLFVAPFCGKKYIVKHFNLFKEFTNQPLLYENMDETVETIYQTDFKKFNKEILSSPAFVDRTDELKEIKGIFDYKDYIILTGESGSGKSVLLNQLINSDIFKIKLAQSDLFNLTTVLNNFVSKYLRIRYYLGTTEINDTSVILILDQLDDVSKDDLVTLFNELVQQFSENDKIKMILTSKSSSAINVWDACVSSPYINKDSVALYIHNQKNELIKKLNIAVNTDTDTAKWMVRLYDALENGKISLLEYQIVNKFYRNSILTTDIFKNFNFNSNIENGITDLFVEYIKIALSKYDNKKYIANLCFIKLLADNRKHQKEEAQYISIEKNIDNWIYFLEKERLVQHDEANNYFTTHEIIGNLFDAVTKTLLSGDVLNAIDLILAGNGKYNDSIKENFSNYRNNEKKLNVIMAALVFNCFINGLLTIIRLNTSSFDLSFSQLLLRFVSTISIFMGVTYMGNFYRYCVNIVKYPGIYYAPGILAIIIHSFLLLSPGIVSYAELIIFALVNASIGVFYLINSKGREANSKLWLKKKGNLFLWIGIIVSIIISYLCYLYVDNEFLTRLICDTMFLAYSIFIYLSIKNYINFQSLAWQRLKIGMKEKVN